MRAALQFGGNLAELCCKFEQCQPRVDLRGLARELQAFFGVLSAFFWRRHDSDPSCETPIPALSFRSATYNSRAPTVPDSILDNPRHWQERAEEARSIADQLEDPESRRMMLRIADDYERLAAHARARMRPRAAQS